MKLQTWPTAARQMLESRKLCRDLWRRQILFPHLALDPADGPDRGGEHDEDEGDGDEGEEDHLEGEGQTLTLLAAVKRVKTVVIVIIAAI